MLRGVITITKEEAKTALDCVQKHLPGTQLEVKLLAAIKQESPEVGLQLGDMEVEQMLDNMEAPSMDDSESKKKLRVSLQNFMAKLKGCD